jgi:hypothetical protein
MSIQKYIRLYEYVHEYQELVYDFYADDTVRFLVTYYNINTDETIWEDTDLFGGPYEWTGEYSGIKRNKILLLPVYYLDEVATSFDGAEEGYNKSGETTIVFPSTYGITPYPQDIIKMEQAFLRPTNDVYPLYIVKGVEISANTDRRYWKLKVETFQSETLQSVDEQVVDTYAYVEYDKQIHTIDDAEFMARLLVKDDHLRECLNDNLFDDRAGFYFTPRQPTTC